MKKLFPVYAIVPVLIFSAALTGACASGSAPALAEPASFDAFPGAEGFGRFTRGGRGGRVIKVTNLDDSGPGSLRAAIEAEGARTVIFDVSGTIELGSELRVTNDFLTIAGQTAPGDGITLKNHGLVVEANEVIVRFIRSRPGDDAGVETDAISVIKGHNVIIDHCSASWATDETLSVSPAVEQSILPIDHVTVQWSIISESLNESVHAKGSHGYGSLVRGNSGSKYSFHHNLWAHHEARMPRPGSYISQSIDQLGAFMDFRNNVFYNWGRKYSGYNADTESVSSYNFINNYYLQGANSEGAIAFEESNPLATLYFSGNLMNGEMPQDPWELVRLKRPDTRKASKPFSDGAMFTERAEVAYRKVLESAGASRARDGVDKRVIADVVNRSGHIIDDVGEVGGWPELLSSPPPPDRDGDGMPDEWERAHGLDAGDAGDGGLDRNSDGYTNLEDYLNSLAPWPTTP